MNAYYRNNGHYDYQGAISYCLSIISSIANKNFLQEGILIAFDNGVPVHRRKLNSEYKPDKIITNNIHDYLLSKMNKNPSENAPDDDRRAFLNHYAKLTNTLHCMILPMLGCISIRVSNCEADDIIGYWTRAFPKEYSIIVSSDKDLLQLINKNVIVYEPMKKVEIELGSMQEKGYDLNNYKSHFLYTKALMGDKSDNIEGIEGIAAKNAILYAKQIVDLLKDSSNLDEALSKVQRNPRASNKALALLKESSEKIITNYKLMDLEYTEYIDFALIERIRRFLLAYKNKKPDFDGLIDKLRQLENVKIPEVRKSMDTIFDSNANGNTKELLKRLV